MPRIVNEQEYAARRNEILDTAMQLVYTKGYEQMSIQDILDALHISKGAFYHYFQSKPDLLEALIQRLIDEGEKVVSPIVEDPDRSALEKLKGFIDTAVRWKTARKDLLMVLMRGWYSDDNAILRQKLSAAGIERYNTWVTVIVRQGVAEGVFHNPYPDQIGAVVFSLILGLGESMAARLLADQPLGEEFPAMVAAYSDALERVLGAPGGTLLLLEPDMLAEWSTIHPGTAEPEASPIPGTNLNG